MDAQSRTASVFWPLRIGLGATAFLAGADKFTNLLTDWEKYLAPEASEKLPVSNKNFMRVVGVVEMLVGVGILSPKAEISSYVASAWLSCIAANLVLNKDYDVAVRDINMAIGAFVLGQLCAARERRIEQGDLAEGQELAA
ncbi:MAG: hypothetical protein JO065_03210 [Acidobacteria bacterium]|nr:hypothetical protein [Acidobacteriota bacterium]MBV9435925.1 hypothetical protein [Acidobacteriota bacterium]